MKIYFTDATFQYLSIPMFSQKKNIDFSHAQVYVWLIAFVINVLSNLQYDPMLPSILFGLVAIFFYFVIIFGNCFVLIPFLYNRQKITWYILATITFLVAAIFLRSIFSVWINLWLGRNTSNRLSGGLLAYSAFSALWIFLFSILYRLAIDYFDLSKKQSAITAEKAQTELSLLKQQVHPHFLFNTLNNIYYVSHTKSPESADLILRLSEIMRYFIEESKKDRVYVKSEIDLLNSYIELETIRLRYEMAIEFQIDGNIDTATIPPLLLLPIVENIFKHGVDRRSKSNSAILHLEVNNGSLRFTASNSLHALSESPITGKTGLLNLRRRLNLYFDDKFTLTTFEADGRYTAKLEFPCYEN